MNKIESLPRSPSLGVLSYAYDKIHKEENRSQTRLSQIEKNRIVLQYLKLNEGIKTRSMVHSSVSDASLNHNIP